MARTRHLALGVVVAFVYAGCYTAIKAGLPYAPPLRFAGLRALIGGTALLALLALSGQPMLPPRRLWPPILALALVGTVVGFGAMFLSPRQTGAGVASVLGNTGPLIVIVLAAAFLGEPITRAKLVALALGLFGVSLITWPSFREAGGGLLATAIPLVAASSGATESVIIKRAAVGADVLRVTAWQFLLGAGPLFALSALYDPDQTIVWNGRFVALLLFMSLGGTAFATALWYWLIQREEVSRLSLVLFLVPVAGLALGIVLFSEQLQLSQSLGIASVIGSVLIVMLARSHAVPPEPGLRIAP